VSTQHAYCDFWCIGGKLALVALEPRKNVFELRRLERGEEGVELVGILERAEDRFDARRCN
jgi:hypothetical protein